MKAEQAQAMFDAYDKVHGIKPCTICNRVHDGFENAHDVYCECNNPVYLHKPTDVWLCDKCNLPIA